MTGTIGLKMDIGPVAGFGQGVWVCVVVAVDGDLLLVVMVGGVSRLLL